MTPRMQHLNSSLIVTVPELKRQAVDWCNEHGVNPNSVPLYALVEVLDEEHLEIQVYDMTAAGQPTWDETTQAPKLRWLHVKTKRPFPEDLLED